MKTYYASLYVRSALWLVGVAWQTKEKQTKKLHKPKHEFQV